MKLLTAFAALSAIMLSSGARADDSCDARMTRLSERLATLAPYAGAGMLTHGDQDLIEVGKASAIEQPGWVVLVHDHRIDLAWSEAPPGSPLAKQVEDFKHHLTDRELAARAHWVTYIAASPTATVGLVREAMREARKAGLTGPTRLLVRLPPPPGATSDAKLLATKSVAELRARIAKKPGERELELSKAMRPAVWPCAAVIKVLGGMHVTARDLATVPAAAQSCRCRLADLDVFEYVLLDYLNAFEDRTAWIEMPRLPANGKRTMADVVKRR